MGGNGTKHVEFVLFIGHISGHWNDRLSLEKRPELGEG